MRKNYFISDSDFERILAINKEGGDPVMFLSGGIPLGKSKQEKINDFWDEMSRRMGFDPATVEGIDNRNFSAESIKAGE